LFAYTAAVRAENSQVTIDARLPNRVREQLLAAHELAAGKWAG
jgi:hypothetical protein